MHQKRQARACPTGLPLWQRGAAPHSRRPKFVSVMKAGGGLPDKTGHSRGGFT